MINHLLVNINKNNKFCSYCKKPISASDIFDNHWSCQFDLLNFQIDQRFPSPKKRKFLFTYHKSSPPYTFRFTAPAVIHSINLTKQKARSPDPPYPVYMTPSKFIDYYFTILLSSEISNQELDIKVIKDPLGIEYSCMIEYISNEFVDELDWLVFSPYQIVLKLTPYI